MITKFFVCILIITISAVAPFSQAADPDEHPYHVQMFKIDDHSIPNSKNYRKNWTRLTGFEYSGLHWGQFVIIYTHLGEQTFRHNYLQYVNWFDDPDDEDNEPSFEVYPVGTVLLKENFSVKNGAPDTPQTVAAMIKRASGFDPQMGDWEYIQLDVQGNIIVQGHSRQPDVYNTCASCHQNVADRDYVFSNIYSSLKTK